MPRQINRRSTLSVLGGCALSGCLNLRPENNGSSTSPQNGAVSESPSPEEGTDRSSSSTSNSEDQWPVSLPAPGTTTPVIDGETAIFGCMDHHVYAIDATSGQRRFKTDIGGQVGPGLTISDQVVYGSSPAGIFGVDLTTGEQILSITDVNVGFGIHEPLVKNEQLFYTADGSLLAFNPTSGGQNWKNNQGSVWGGKPALLDGTLVTSDAGDVDTFPSDRSRVYGIDPEDGSIQWRKGITEDSLVSSVAVHEGKSTAVLVGRGGMTAAFDVNTGEEQWRVSVTRDGNVTGGPKIVEDTVIVPLGNNGLYAYDVATGEERWKKDGRSDIRTQYSCQVLNETVFTARGNEVFEIDYTSGEVVSTVQLSERLADSTQPLVTTNSIIYPTQGSTVRRALR